VRFANPGVCFRFRSIGGALTDTLDDLITQNNIDPQLAMKVLANFDRAITEVLQEKVRSRLTFKVSRQAQRR
jgi:transcription initiation factor TFIIA small subunit